MEPKNYQSINSGSTLYKSKSPIVDKQITKCIRYNNNQLRTLHTESMIGQLFKVLQFDMLHRGISII